MSDLEGAISLRYTVSGEDFSLAGNASGDVKTQLRLIGIPREAVRKAVVALYEAEINLVIHANGGEIEVDILPDEILMRVEDSGPGIHDLELAMQEGYSTANEEIRNLGFGAGMGLANMKKYTDHFEIASTVGIGTKISMGVKY